jgi:tRNA A-37 threonylcarbamoyl transferase component Bud32
MNADGPSWSIVCILPVLLLAISTAIFVVVIVARAVGTIPRRDKASRPLKRVLVVGVPIALLALGVFCTAIQADRGLQPIAATLPAMIGLFLAAGTALGLSRWAFPEWWARGQRLTGPDRQVPLARPSASGGTTPWGRWLAVVFAALLCGGGLFLLLALTRGGIGSLEKLPFALVPLGVGALILWLVLPTLYPHWRAKVAAAHARSATEEPRITILHALFTKMGVAIALGGLFITGLIWVLTESGILAVVFGGAFVFTVLALHASQLKATAKVMAANAPNVVAPLLLTPDPTAVRRDCPTCLYPIPADSPHGLCPRCLIRGAMPSPTSTRVRGVGPIDPPTPAEVGEFFPHLEVLELIGAGGMGAVYKVRQPTLDRIVALKIVQSPRGDDDPVFAERFAREARAMAKLDHPNIVTIHESGEAGGLPFLLMEYVDGVTLREAMVNRLLTATEALAVIPQVCDALDYAHRAGVVHRDIKPENILLDQTGRVKIADFGLAKLADPKNVTLTRTQQAMGTPHYMAPEQWERPNDVDHRADVYALGVVLYELLTGELPLGRFALPSEKGKGDVRLDQVVIRALAKDPAERFQHAGQMKAALSGVKLAAFTPAVPRRKGVGAALAAWARGLWPW